MAARKKFGYLIPYRTTGNPGELEVLIGTKQVLSFEAIAKQSVGDSWKSIDFANPINEQGWVKTWDRQAKIGTRFSGMLLPGGGKPCFFGGSAINNESHEDAAIRELKEELNLTTNADFALEQTLETNWGGRYFAFDASKLVQDWQTHLNKLNQQCAYWESLPLQQVSTQRANWYPEVREIRWIDAQEALRQLESFDKPRTKSEVDRFASFIVGTVRVNVNVQNFSSALLLYMSKQDVADNANALRAFIKAKRA